MNTIWIYLPPVILVGSIIGLLILLGRKSKRAGKEKMFEKNDSSASQSMPEENKKRFSRIGNRILPVLEKILLSAKMLIKKSEDGLAKLVSNIRARRADKKTFKELYKPSSEKSKSFTGDDQPKESDRLMDMIKRDMDSQDELKAEEKKGWISSGLAARRKKESVPRLEEPVPAEEDKEREEALIHRIAENPKDTEAYRELGDYYLAVGNTKDAKDSFKMVLKLRPRDLKAKSSLREIEMRMRLGK